MSRLSAESLSSYERSFLYYMQAGLIMVGVANGLSIIFLGLTEETPSRVDSYVSAFTHVADGHLYVISLLGPA